MQQGLKNNHEDLSKYCNDLDGWYKEVAEKDKNKQVRETAFQKGVSIIWNILDHFLT
jgi:hypothetical protein